MARTDTRWWRQSRLMRVLLIAAVASVLLGAAGLGWEFARFGTSDASTMRRLEAEVRARIADRTRDVETLAASVAAEGPLVADATANRDRRSVLFDRLMRLAEPVDQHGVAATIYVPAHIPATENSYVVLAWSNGPGEKNVTPDRLAGPATLFVAPGYAGLRLLATRPIEAAGHRVGVVVAETVLAPARPGPPDPAGRDDGAAPARQLITSFGPVEIRGQYLTAREPTPPPDAFVVSTEAGAPLLEVHMTRGALAAQRQAARRSIAAIALSPWPIALWLTAFLVSARRRARGDAGAWIGWTAGATAIAMAGTVVAVRIARLAGIPAVATSVIVACTSVALVALVAGGWWWRGGRPRIPSHAPVQFVLEQFVGGATLAMAIESVARLLTATITRGTLDKWRFVLFPFDAEGLLVLGYLLLAELALAWGGALVLVAIRGRWRLRGMSQVTAATLWLLPFLMLLLLPASQARYEVGASGVLLLAAMAFAFAAPRLRRVFHHTTQSMRLLGGLLALLTPLAAIYPMSAITTERAVRALIEDSYAPATARHPDELRAELVQSLNEIDRLPTLGTLVGGAPSVDSPAAFFVWSQTSLIRTRVVSDVELYGPAPDRTLVSRFALNLPDYLYRSSAQTWQGSSCTWDVFVTPFGADARPMLTAERGVCDEQGRLLGGIAVHVASYDYQALPFLSSANPYYDVLGVPTGAESGPRLPDLQVAVYGWSLQPLFTSGGVAWPLSQPLFEQLYRSGMPFWTTLVAGGRTYSVHVSQNRSGIYALGYPRATWFEHAMRLAEITALVCVFFVVIEIGAAIASPLSRRRTAPLRLLFNEVRTSFYRKLFLFFVAAAVVPVVSFALVFAGYMTARFTADVQSEAQGIVSVARRVFDELTLAETRGEPPAPTDDVMVLIRQVIGQDVNLFQGSELVATSQRDLFDSGLLPTRTPAPVYRAIVLDRLPTFVADDQLGDLQYLVAASPVARRGPETILTVPLAPRQRELERELNEFNRGVLVGAVLVVLFAAAIGASMAARIADPVARLTRATRQVAAGRLDVNIAADTNDELRRLVDDFNTMTRTLLAQRAGLARANQLEAWTEMARQVAHEIKNPLTPIQLAAEHLRHVHADRGRPLGAVADQCIDTVLAQVRLLRQIASEFSTFSGRPTPHFDQIDLVALISAVVDPYRLGSDRGILVTTDVPPSLPPVSSDRTLLARALTNLVENAVQAMPTGGRLRVSASVIEAAVRIEIADTGVGMDAATLERAFEPYFSTKTGGSGLGLANARQHIELSGGALQIASTPGVGTTVTVTLPVAGAGARPDGTAPAPSPFR